MWEIRYKAVDVNVNLQETAHSPKNVSDSNVFLFVEKTPVGRTLIAKLEITVPNVHVLQIFSEMATPGVTPNVLNTTIAHETRLALNSNVEIPVGNLIQTFVVKVQTVRLKTTNQSARAQEVILEIPSITAENLPVKIFANPILVGMELHASLAMTGQDLIDLSAHAHLEQEEIH
jgi:hypothetical protein